MKNIPFFIMGILLPILSASAQPNAIKLLSIGDTVPDIVFNNIINYKTTSAKLSDFKGKLLILDFWNTHCSPCIKALPKLDSLQKQFGEKIAILPVTYEKADVLERWLAKRRRKSPELDLPFVVNDTLLRKTFPHGSVPHEVWISPEGIVLYQTDDYFVTGQNILAVLNGEILELADKGMEEKDSFSSTDFLLPGNNEVDGNRIRYQSLFTGPINGGYAGGLFNTLIDSGKAFLYTAINFNPLALLSIINDFYSLQRIVLENVQDSMRYTDPGKRLYTYDRVAYRKWQTEHALCYQLMLPVPDYMLHKPEGEIRSFMNRQARIFLKEDLGRYFRIRHSAEISLQNRTVKCLVLCNKEVPTPPSAGKLTAADITRILDQTIGAALHRPVINETSASTNNINGLSAYNNLNKIRQELDQQGLQLLEENRSIPMVVIAEKDISHLHKN